MEYEYAQMLYKYIERFKLEYKNNKRHYREIAYYFNIDVHKLKLDDNEVAEVKCNSNRCKIILNDALNNSDTLIMTIFLIPVALLYKETEDNEFSNVKVRKNDVIKYSNLYKMFAYDILFNQDNLYKCINESREKNVQKR